VRALAKEINAYIAIQKPEILSLCYH